MTQTVTPEPSAAVSNNVLARLVAVVFSPRSAYAAVAARPRVLGALVVVLAIIVSATFTFLSTDVGQQASLANQVQQMESFGRTVTDAQYAQMERMAPYSRYFAAGAQLIVTPIMALIVAGLAFAVFNAVMGGDAPFKAVYAIVVHSGAIMVLQAMFSLPIAYARESMSGATNLAVFFPFLDDNSFAARLFGSIDLFLIWWIVSVSIGLGVLYRKRTGPIATTMLIVYVLIGVLIATIKSMTSGA
jgi:Yip1-like protein